MMQYDLNVILKIIGHKKKKNEISGHDYGILGDKFIRLVNKMEGYPKIGCGSITNK